MKRTKGIGPNNLGVSKSAVKNQNKGYAGDFGSMVNQAAVDNAEAKKKEQPDASGKKPPQDPKQNMADAMAKQTKGQTDTFGPGGTNPNPKLYAGIVAEAEKKGKKEEGSMASQTRAEIKATKLASKAEQAVKDDNMNKNEKLVTRHNNFINRKGLNKKPIAYG